ncbi:A24 family peptidase [Aliiglaciecola sp. CAU 1673]|uniref:prepilin peptidase n=1 Tax=Aliiglaciecola sp. CAU 1673 TaxID=3032595 RepID=UPI0023D9E433|nr:A24 family peptidase [Aliiglaciecola sp. CAU 1673]MDF2178419.1 A24 family peptidase [Aliiglaciecola sp. CAU 1673]
MPEIFILLESSPLAWSFTALLLGLIIGSFLNVVIHRLPIMMETSWKQEYQNYFHPEQTQPDTPTYNLVTPNSSCPKCGHQIRAWENIPLISWLALKGKCSQCATRIPVRYPLVELFTGLVSGFVAWHYGFTPMALAVLILSWMLVAMIFIDLDRMLLPDQLTLPLLWLGLLASLGVTHVSPTDAIIGAAAGYLSLWSVYWAFKLLTGKEGMGYGDFKLLAALGAWVGWQYLPMIILLSSCVGAVFGISMMLLRKKQSSDSQSMAIPFGPYLAVAGWLTLLYGHEIADLYWSLILG